ncbi:MAG: hypothetical protein ACREQ9_10015, partial [Candidatus Binatia bacterium]
MRDRVTVWLVFLPLVLGLGARAENLTALPVAPVPIVVSPIDPSLLYSEYVRADVTFERARFDRGISTFTRTHTPAVRVNFATDALQVNVRVKYRKSCLTPGCGSFFLEVDGVVQPQAVGDSVVSSAGDETFLLFRQSGAVTHDFSLIFPYAAAVDFKGLELFGGTPLLGSAPERPGFVYVAHGDSITQGFYSTGTIKGYPSRIAQTKGWSVIN